MVWEEETQHVCLAQTAGLLTQFGKLEKAAVRQEVNPSPMQRNWLQLSAPWTQLCLALWADDRATELLEPCFLVVDMHPVSQPTEVGCVCHISQSWSVGHPFGHAALHANLHKNTSCCFILRQMGGLS